MGTKKPRSTAPLQTKLKREDAPASAPGATEAPEATEAPDAPDAPEPGSTDGSSEGTPTSFSGSSGASDEGAGCPGDSSVKTSAPNSRLTGSAAATAGHSRTAAKSGAEAA